MNEFPLEWRGAECLFPGRTEQAVCWPGDDGGWKVGRIKCRGPVAIHVQHPDGAELVYCRESHHGPDKLVRRSVIRPYPESPIPEPGNG